MRTEHRTAAASVEADGAFSLLVVIGTLALAWVATYVAGGSRTALPHAFYVPVIIAAARFGSRGALAVSLLAGIVAGPLLPLDVGAGSVQSMENWLARLVAFVVIGQLTAYLRQRSLPSLTEELAAHRFRSELREAIDRREIRLVYQPIVDLRTGELAGVEALARWQHPQRGEIPPSEFIPEAERLGCVGELTRHVIRDACQQAAAWRDTELRGRDTFKLAVNVSGADIADPDLCDHVSAVLAETGLPNHWLHLEVTETALVGDVEEAVARLMDLRMLGIRLAIDDFGTGESSLGHLQQFPLDTLKIDRVFVSRVDRGQPSDVVAHGIVALAQAMNLRTVAEGVETSAQARIVRDFGCDLAQGHLFSPPLGPADLHSLLQNDRHFRDRNVSHLTSEVADRSREPSADLDDRWPFA